MTRAEAIRRLESMATDLTGACAEAQSDKVSEYIARKIQAIDMAIAALKEQDVTDINVGNKWISVKERLPEKYTIVLCYKDGQRRLGYYIGAEYGKGVAAFRHPKDQFAFGVTHWMPLPEPPKEDAG